jgi:hypothetical protein
MRARKGHARTDRWHVVTVNRPPDEVLPGGRRPEPLSELGDAVDVRAVPAPGDRGTELGARLREGASLPPPRDDGATVDGNEPRQRVRTALRNSKQLLETGEILRPDNLGTARTTLLNLPLTIATRVARGEGIL